MRHDDSSRRPRVDPTQNPRLAAALGRLSQGIRDAIDETPSERAAAASALAAGNDEVYVPDNDEVELIDDGPETVQREGIEQTPYPGPRSYEGEMIPTSDELQPMPFPNGGMDAALETPPPPSLERAPIPSHRHGVIAYGAPLPPEPPPEDEVLEPSDSELELVDAPVHPGAGDAALEAAADYGSAPSTDAPAYEGASDLDPTPLYDAPPEPSGELSAEPPAEPTGDSPWATAAAAAPIDARDLPSSHAPIAPVTAPEQPKPAAEPDAAAQGKPGRSWLTIFLAIALVASVVTFLLLKFNVIAGPEGRPSTDRTPIQVPTSPTSPTSPTLAPAAPPTEPTVVAAPEPPVPAAPEPSASAAPEPPVTGAPGAGAAPTTTPGGQAPGAGTAPTGGIKPGGPSQSGKKPSRIF